MVYFVAQKFSNRKPLQPCAFAPAAEINLTGHIIAPNFPRFSPVNIYARAQQISYWPLRIAHITLCRLAKLYRNYTNVNQHKYLNKLQNLKKKKENTNYFKTCTRSP